MRIGIDISTINKSKTGIEYFVYSITKQLVQSDGDNEFLLYTNDILKGSDFKNYPNVKIIEIKANRGNFIWMFKVASRAKKEVDLFLSPANFAFGFLMNNTFQVVHDIAPIKFPKFFPFKDNITFRILLKLAILRSRLLLVNLETVKQELVTFDRKALEKTVVIGCGLNEWSESDLNQNEVSETLEKYSLQRKYILTTGTLQPRKNHINMIKAFKMFLKTNPDYDFVVVGKKGWFYQEIFEVVKKLKLEERVRFLGYLDELELKHLYKQADGFVFCSFYEGFGMPPLEAAHFNTPILLSDINSSREIFGEYVLYCDPYSPESILRGMKEIIKIEKRDYSEILQKYTWENAANKLIENFRKSTLD